MNSSIELLNIFEKREELSFDNTSSDVHWLPLYLSGKVYRVPLNIPDNMSSIIQYFTSRIDTHVYNHLFEIPTSSCAHIFRGSSVVLPIEARVDSFNMDVNRLMTAELNKISFAVLDVIEREKKAGVPIKTIGLNTFSDPEAKEAEEIVFELVLQCSADDAMQYWSKLSHTIAGLKSKLSPDESYLLDSKVAVNVDWE